MSRAFALYVLDTMYRKCYHQTVTLAAKMIMNAMSHSTHKSKFFHSFQNLGSIIMLSEQAIDRCHIIFILTVHLKLNSKSFFSDIITRCRR